MGVFIPRWSILVSDTKSLLKKTWSLPSQSLQCPREVSTTEDSCSNTYLCNNCDKCYKGDKKKIKARTLKSQNTHKEGTFRLETQSTGKQKLKTVFRGVEAA